MDVAIRVMNEKAMSEDGLHFLEEAINILMYDMHSAEHTCRHVSNYLYNSFLCCSREFQHANLLKLYGICSQEGPVLYIITELLTRGMQLNFYFISKRCNHDVGVNALSMYRAIGSSFRVGWQLLTMFESINFICSKMI